MRIARYVAVLLFVLPSLDSDKHTVNVVVVFER